MCNVGPEEEFGPCTEKGTEARDGLATDTIKDTRA